MKKLICMVLSLCVLCLPVLCLAETDLDAATVALDVSNILSTLVALLAAVLSSALAYVWRKYIKPWLVKNDLMDVAEIVVNAAEAIKGRGYGEEKWKIALEKIAGYGYDVNNDAVLDAVRAAWKQLDLTQLLAGEKTAAETEPEEQPVADVHPPEESAGVYIGE